MPFTLTGLYGAMLLPCLGDWHWFWFCHCRYWGTSITGWRGAYSSSCPSSPVPISGKSLVVAVLQVKWLACYIASLAPDSIFCSCVVPEMFPQTKLFPCLRSQKALQCWLDILLVYISFASHTLLWGGRFCDTAVKQPFMQDYATLPELPLSPTSQKPPKTFPHLPPTGI